MIVRLMRLACAVACVAMAACSPVGPAHRVPDVPVPAAFDHAGPWRAAVPGDLVGRGEWWQVFDDPALDDLQQRARRSSPTLAVYVARLEQARAVAGIAGSFRQPEVNAGLVLGRGGVSGNRPDQPDKRAANRAYDTSVLRVPLTVGYEVDLWGRIRRLTESANARADAALAEYHTVCLTLEAEIATLHFRLRQIDEERRLLRDSLALQQRARDLVVARQRGGLASELDTARIETDLALTEAAIADAGRRRDSLELALSAVVGETPEGFRVAAAMGAFPAEPPVIPPGLPSDLLERRPDIAEAERALAARNAEIGVSQAAYFPAIRLTGSIGLESAQLSDFLSADSVIWSLGTSLFQPVFNAGRIGQDVRRAEAAHAEAASWYRGRLLRAFREVEEALVALRTLEEQAGHQERARVQADKAVRLSEARYRAGLVGILETIDARRTALRAEREALSVRADRFAASVQLVKSLGGGWLDRQATPVAAVLGGR